MADDGGFDRVEALREIDALLAERNLIRAERLVDRVSRQAPNDPDVTGLLIRVKVVAALARRRRDGLAMTDLGDVLRSLVDDTGQLLAPYPSSLMDTDELALGRAAHLLLTKGRERAESSLVTALSQQPSPDAKAGFVSRLAASWVLDDVIGAVDSVDDRAATPLVARMTEVVLSTPLDHIDVPTALVAGRALLNSAGGVLREVGADLADHAIEVWPEDRPVPDELLILAVDSIAVRSEIRGPNAVVAHRGSLLSRRFGRGQLLADDRPPTPDAILRVVRRLPLDLYVLLSKATISSELAMVAPEWRRLRETIVAAERVGDHLNDAAKEHEDALRRMEARPTKEEAAMGTEVRDAIGAARSAVKELHTAASEVWKVARTAQILSDVTMRRLQTASDALVLQPEGETEAERAIRLLLLMEIQTDLGRFEMIKGLAEQLAQPLTPLRDVPSDRRRTVAYGRLHGLVWLRRLDEAHEQLTEAQDLNALTRADVLDVEVTIAIERIGQSADVADRTRAAHRCIERVLEHLDDEEHRESEEHLDGEALDDDENRDGSSHAVLTRPHIRRRARRRALLRARYLVLMDQLGVAQQACRLAQRERTDADERDATEDRARDMIEAVIALRRGNAESVQDILEQHADPNASTEPVRRLLNAIAAAEHGDIGEARERLGELYVERPGDVAVMLAYVNVLRIPSGTRPPNFRSGADLETGSSATERAGFETGASTTERPGYLTRLAAHVLADLRRCIETEGEGFSMILDERNARHVLLSSASVHAELALREWSDRRRCGLELDHAEHFLQQAAALDARGPEHEGMDAHLRQLRKQWCSRRPRWWQYLVAALLVVGGVTVWWLQDNTTLTMAVTIGAGLAFPLAAVVLLFPWLQKLTFHGFEFSRSELERVPQHLALTAEPEALMAVLREQARKSLQSTMVSTGTVISLNDVKLPSTDTTLNRTVFEPSTKQGAREVNDPPTP